MENDYAQFFEWCSEIIKDSLNFQLIVGSNKYKTIFENFEPSFEDNISTVIHSQRTIYSSPIYQVGYAVSVLSVTYKKISCIYGTIFWLNGEPKFLSLSPSYVSHDGDYRRSFLKYETYAEHYNEKSKCLSKFEEKCLETSTVSEKTNARCALQIKLFGSHI